MLGRWRRRNEEFFARQADRLREHGEALRPVTRRIWLEPGYPTLEPVRSDVGPELESWVWSAATLPVSEPTRKALERWAIEGFDRLYKNALYESEGFVELAQAFEAKGVEIVGRVRADLGPEWQVGLFSAKLDRPVWDLDEMPPDEWRHRA